VTYRVGWPKVPPFERHQRERKCYGATLASRHCDRLYDCAFQVRAHGGGGSPSVRGLVASARVLATDVAAPAAAQDRTTAKPKGQAAARLIIERVVVPRHGR